MFDQSNLIKYPSLSSFDSTLLCGRAIGLQRVAKVLDSVLEILVGPSLKRDQFDTPYKVNSSFSTKLTMILEILNDYFFGRSLL